MGKHFDTLVDIVNRHMPKDVRVQGIRDLRQYLHQIIEACALFEFPFNPKDILPQTGKDSQEYHRYLLDYFDLSERYGKFLLTPFELTAVEDEVSVVVMDNICGNNYRVIVSYKNENSQYQEELALVMGYIKLYPNREKTGITCETLPVFLGKVFDGDYCGGLLGAPGVEGLAAGDLSSAAISYIDEVVYIMDPLNFIIERESNQSIRQTERSERKSKNKQILRKTMLRPHYLVMDEPATKDFLQDESRVPRPFHPVRGHWRTFASCRYVNMQGQRIYIRQHYRGKGDIEGRNGLNYRVFIKDSPVDITPFNER